MMAPGIEASSIAFSTNSVSGTSHRAAWASMALHRTIAPIRSVKAIASGARIPRSMPRFVRYAPPAEASHSSFIDVPPTDSRPQHLSEFIAVEASCGEWGNPKPARSEYGQGAPGSGANQGSCGGRGASPDGTGADTSEKLVASSGCPLWVMRRHGVSSALCVRYSPQRWGNRPAYLWIAEDLGCCA